MPRLPSRFAAVIPTFAPLFLQRTWRHAAVLLTGATLAPGQRTVASVLRITGLARERRFVNYHRVLNRAAWRPRAAARLLFGLLVAAFVPAGPVVLYQPSEVLTCRSQLVLVIASRLRRGNPGGKIRACSPGLPRRKRGSQ